MKKLCFSSKVYSKFSIGALINNDFLVFNSFQISFSYYPTIPFEGDNIINLIHLKIQNLSYMISNCLSQDIFVMNSFSFRFQVSSFWNTDLKNVSNL